MAELWTVTEGDLSGCPGPTRTADRTGDLMGLIAPPQAPDRDWPDTATDLPDDYQHFLSVYGVGTVDLFLDLLTPERSSGQTRVFWKVVDQICTGSWMPLVIPGITNGGDPESLPQELIAQLRAADRVQVWAVTDNGDTCLWLQPDADRPEQQVVITDSKMLDFVTYDLGITELLYALLSGHITCDVFPADFPGVCGLPVRRTDPEITALLSGEHAFLTYDQARRVSELWENP